jgi:hypothetical protein
MVQKFIDQQTRKAQRGPQTIEQLETYVGLPILPLRLFWQNLEALRPWWSVLLPFLAWLAWRTYTGERARVLAERTARAHDNP